MKKFKKIIIVLILLLSLGIGITYVKADSGWDSSYDSGSSSSSHSGSSRSSHSSSSSRNKNTNKNYNGESHGTDPGATVVILVVFGVLYIFSGGLLTWAILKYGSKGNDKPPKREYKSIDDSELSKYGLDKDLLLNMAKDKYLQVQTDWMNFNYDGLQNNLTDELFNQYSMNLATLSAKGQKNIMEDMNILDCFITKIGLENEILTIKVYLKVHQRDYVVDSNNKVVRGSKHMKMEMEYILTFVKKHSDTKAKCPSCGHKIESNVSEICPYCKNKLVVAPQDFVMSKKTAVNQRNI